MDLAGEVEEQIHPLGVLFHIAAGNMDGLPAYSVIEGLLAGNINLLKLPAVDEGLTVMILGKLCEIEPRLAEYIYVFELSSAELRTMKRLANQLLCSSCQGIYLDVSSEEEAKAFCRSFLPLLDAAAAEYPDIPLAAKAQNSLKLQTRRLENSFGDKVEIFKGERTSLLLESDCRLTVSMQYRNLWVRRLERSRIITRLHPYKNYLQTAALLCSDAEWEELRGKLWRAGVVQISQGSDMSGSYCGAAHDGEYPLRRYTRVVSARK